MFTYPALNNCSDCPKSAALQLTPDSGLRIVLAINRSKLLERQSKPLDQQIIQCSKGNPNCSKGDPNCSKGNPNCSKGDPDCSKGDPNCSKGDPDCSKGNPNCSKGNPNCSKGDPNRNLIYCSLSWANRLEHLHKQSRRLRIHQIEKLRSTATISKSPTIVLSSSAIAISI